MQKKKKVSDSSNHSKLIVALIVSRSFTADEYPQNEGGKILPILRKKKRRIRIITLAKENIVDFSSSTVLCVCVCDSNSPKKKIFSPSTGTIHYTHNE